MLCGMSSDYYSRIERGTGAQPSGQMVAAMARGLHLDLDERDHMFALAGYTAPSRGLRAEHVNPGLMRVIDRLDDTAVQVVARELDLPIIFSSSREVYGDVHRFEEYAETVADFAFTESTYSASKIAGEAFVYSYARCYGLRYLVFRFSNVYGRYDNDLQRMVRVLPLWIHKLSRGEAITVYGEDKMLDFTYVDDCVDGIVRGIEALGSGRVANDTVNLAYGHGNRLLRAAEMIADVDRPGGWLAGGHRFNQTRHRIARPRP